MKGYFGIRSYIKYLVVQQYEIYMEKMIYVKVVFSFFYSKYCQMIIRMNIIGIIEKL